MPKIGNKETRIWIPLFVLSILHVLNFKFNLQKVINLHETSNCQSLPNHPVCTQAADVGDEKAGRQGG